MTRPRSLAGEPGRKTGRLRVGSEEHKRLFCGSFVETHVPFRPEEIPWPDLDRESLARLKALPVWNEAAETEAATALKVTAAGEAESDPVLAEAISLQGYEESRHASVIRLLTERYGIPLRPCPPPTAPKRPASAFMKVGYGECLDSFFAFGLFSVGKRSHYFPMDLIDVFEPIMQEEARHILFLVNWVGYLRARTSPWLRPLFDAHRLYCIAAQIVEHAKHALSFGDGSDSQEGFTMASHSAFEDLSLRSFLALCLAENERRLAPYDSRLLRPAIMPSAASMALRLLPHEPTPAARSLTSALVAAD